MQYFEKRYYDNRIGRFTTEDPVYWEVGFFGDPNSGEDVAENVSSYFVAPQNWNSYTYAFNNPINIVDPSGEVAVVLAPAVAFVFTGPVGLFLGGVALVGGVGTLLYTTLNQSATNKPQTQQANTGAGQTNQGSISQVQSQVATASPPPSGGGGKKDDKNTNNQPSKQKFENDKGTILKDSENFQRTNYRYQNANVYKEKSTGNYLYRDNFHKDHLEVFGPNRQHLGNADPLTGRIYPGTAIKGRILPKF